MKRVVHLGGNRLEALTPQEIGAHESLLSGNEVILSLLVAETRPPRRVAPNRCTLAAIFSLECIVETDRERAERHERERKEEGERYERERKESHAKDEQERKEEGERHERDRHDS